MRVRWVTFALVLILLLFSTGNMHVAAPAETRLMRFPDIWNEQVTFVYAGDIWVASTKGGEARRLTAHVGDEQYPKFSPDGRWIAFTGEYDGNADVYVIPTAGGEPRRLTHHPGRDMVLGWSRDGRVLFRSPRVSDLPDFDRLFLVSVDGGMPEMLSIPRASLTSFSPDGQKIAYNYSSQEFRTWKRYRGGWKSPIAIFDLKNHTYEKLPTTEAMDMFPMWSGNSIYFISDRDGVMNLYRYELSSKRTSQLTHYREFDIKWPSLGPNAIAYENGGELYAFDLKNNEPRKVPVYVGSDQVTARPEFRNVASRIRTFALSPSGTRAVFTARGEIFTVPAENGSPRNITETAGVHEFWGEWSPDGKWIAYLSDKTGEYEIYLRPQRGGEEQRITSDGDAYRYGLVWSPDSKKLAYWDKKIRLFYVDIEKKQPVLVDTGQFRSQPQPVWSPDSRWIAYSKQGSNRNGAIWLYSVEQNKATQVTDGFYRDYNPAFDSNGKYLYFLSSRFFTPSAGNYDLRFNYYNTTGLFVATLKADEPSPFAAQSDEEKEAEEKKTDEKKTDEKKPDAAAGEKKTDAADQKDKEAKEAEKKPGEAASKDAKKPEPKPIQVDLAGIGSRIERVPVPPGNYFNLQARTEKLFYVATPALPPPPSAQPGPPQPQGVLNVFDVKKRKNDALLTGINNYDLNKEGNKLIYMAGETVGIVDAAPGKKVGDGRLNLSAMQVLVDPREEWKQMLKEAWRIERDFFWDPEMGGLDWASIGKRYEALLPHVAHRSDLNYIIGEMIAELSTSHAYVGGGDVPQRPRVGVGMLGADFEVNSGFYRLKKIFPGESWDEQTRSPLAEAGLKVKEGHYLIAVNGQSVRPPREVYAHFQNLAGKVVTLKVNDKPSEQGAWDTNVKPVGSEDNIRYLSWIETNRKKVAEATGGRIGYMHVPSTSIDGLIMFDRYLQGQQDKDGFIIDERYNHGGFIPDFFTEKLGRPFLSYLSPREGKDIPVPFMGIYGPKVMIVNERAGSGGDCFPWFFKKQKIGPVVGTRTWGGLVGISGSVPMIDGGVVTAPEFAFWTPNEKGGEWIVENYGVDPDYEVEQRPDLEVKGADPQLEKAIELVKAGLKQMTPVAPRPKYPRQVWAEKLQPGVKAVKAPAPAAAKAPAPAGK